MITAFARGDAEQIRCVVTPDVVFHAGGHSQFAGDYRGIDTILAMFGRLVQATNGTLEVEVHDMLANDQHGVILLREKAQRNGETLEFEVTDVHHFRDGRISEIWSQPADERAFEEFFA